ncbi:MAG: hypothetical protein WAR22_00685 [Desulfomonilia bacterium]
MNRVFTRRNIVFGLLLVSFIIVFEIVLARLGLPAWPAFMVMVCFFVEHENPGTALNILIGGFCGIFCVVLLGLFESVFSAYLGAEAAKLTFIGLFVYSIVLFKDFLPQVFNSFAFLFFLAASIASRTSNPQPFVWMGTELVVGGIFIAGVLGIGRLTAAILGEQGEVAASVEPSCANRPEGEP